MQWTSVYKIVPEPSIRIKHIKITDGGEYPLEYFLKTVGTIVVSLLKFRFWTSTQSKGLFSEFPTSIDAFSNLKFILGQSNAANSTDSTSKILLWGCIWIINVLEAYCTHMFQFQSRPWSINHLIPKWSPLYVWLMLLSLWLAFCERDFGRE